MPSGSGPTRQSLGVYTCLFSISSSPFELLKSPHLGGHKADPSTCSSRKTLSEFQPLSVQRARGRGNARGGNKNQGSDLLTWPLCRAQAPSTSGGLGVGCPQQPGPSAGLALHLPRGAWTPSASPSLEHSLLFWGPDPLSRSSLLEPGISHSSRDTTQCHQHLPALQQLAHRASLPWARQPQWRTEPPGDKGCIRAPGACRGEGLC